MQFWSAISFISHNSLWLPFQAKELEAAADVVGKIPSGEDFLYSACRRELNESQGVTETRLVETETTGGRFRRRGKSF